MSRRFVMAGVLVWIVTGSAGCVRYAWDSGHDSFRLPEVIAEEAAEVEDQPVVLLITGSTIVAEFFDVMRDRLRERGFRAVVYQPPELFTTSLEDGAERIGKAVDAIVARTGQDRIHIIAECNGGIATRYYVEQLGGHEKVDRFVSFVSAHNGTTYFKVPMFPSLAEIDPQSSFMRRMAQSRLPDDAQTRMYSIYVCGDEVMKPHTTSAYPGATNIEICDDELAQRARKRKPYKVDHALGQAMIPMYRQHFACFWDEAALELFVTCLTADDETLREFDELQVTFAE